MCPCHIQEISHLNLVCSSTSLAVTCVSAELFTDALGRWWQEGKTPELYIDLEGLSRKKIWRKKKPRWKNIASLIVISYTSNCSWFSNAKTYWNISQRKFYYKCLCYKGVFSSSPTSHSKQDQLRGQTKLLRTLSNLVLKTLKSGLEQDFNNNEIATCV